MNSLKNGTILFFCHYKTYAFLEKYAGMADAARKRNCAVRFINYGSLTQPLNAYLKFWNPVGIISDTPYYRTGPNNSTCPTVFLDVDRSMLRHGDTLINFDSVKAGEVAANAFLREGVTNFGFVSIYGHTYWSEARHHGFAKVVESHGGTVIGYNGNCDLGNALAVQKDIRKWIAQLPKPCGIFAVNDLCADYVVSTCQVMGVRVPSEVAIIGVDNDAMVCENAFHPISSVEPDFRAGGALAVEAIECLRRGEKPTKTTCGPLRFVRRDSSRMMKRSDLFVNQALDFIRADACKGLKARDVVSQMNCPRRTLEERFRAATGQSILEAIEEVRYNRSVDLLKNKSLRLDEIAAECGFSTAGDYSRFFKRHAGVSPRIWRLQYK